MKISSNQKGDLYYLSWGTIASIKDNVSFFLDISVKKVQIIFDYFSLVGKLMYGVNLLLIVNRFIFKILYIIRKILLSKINLYFGLLFDFFTVTIFLD